jgi:hypothetical protein
MAATNSPFAFGGITQFRILLRVMRFFLGFAELFPG